MRTLVKLLLLAALASLAWHYRADLVKLVDAGKREPSFSGYGEGEFVYVGPALAGRLESLSVKQGDQVAAGAPLFVLESDWEKAALALAEAEAASAEATWSDMLTGKRPPEIQVLESQLAQAQANERETAVQLARDIELYRKGGVTGAQLDQSQSAQDANLARIRETEAAIVVAKLPGRDMQVQAQSDRVDSARAAVAEAAWAVEQKRVAAPAGGRVYDVLYRRGEWVGAGQPVVKLLPPENVKIRFFVPEAALAGFAVGKVVTVRRDGVADVEMAVSYISGEAEFTPPVIYSNESRQKLSYMIEARPRPEDAAGLHPGQPVVVFPR